MTNWQLAQADIRDWFRDYDGPQFHAAIMDAPYHLGEIVKRFSNGEPEHTKTAQDIKHRRTPFARQAAGFLGHKWDGGDIAFRVETWDAMFKVLLPGAFLIAFGGTKGYHRMACAIEDAGFIIHPALGWLFGQGFPKATNHPDFAGYYYGGQTLKPAFEFICMAQKPYVGKPAASMRKYGAGLLNIDGCRLDSAGIKHDASRGGFFSGQPDNGTGAGRAYNPKGRWPANLMMDAFAAGYLDRTTGLLKSGLMKAGTKHTTDGGFMGGFKDTAATTTDTYGDSGGPSRYFFRALEDRISNSDPVRYEKKPGSTERTAGYSGETRHPTVKPISLTRYLAALLLPPEEFAPNRRLLVPFAGSGSEMIGALHQWDDIVGIEWMPEYVELAQRRLAYWEQHPPQARATQLSFMDTDANA